MPILKIRIDDVDTEFKIIPLNKKINWKIQEKFSNYMGDGVLLLDRAGYLSHVIKEPKMTKLEWEKVPVSLIDKIIRNIDAYIDSIYLKESSLRGFATSITVYEAELDNLYRYLEEDTEDWIWDRIQTIEKNIKTLKEEKSKIEKSLDYVKSNYVVYEEGKEVSYDVQPLQLECEQNKE